MSNPFPSAETFLTRLQQLHRGSSKHDDKPELPEHFRDPLCDFLANFYKRAFLTLRSLPEDNLKLLNPRETFRVFLTASYQALNNFRDALPLSVLVPEQPSLLSETVTLNLDEPYRMFAAPFSKQHSEFRAVGLATTNNSYPPYYGDFSESEPRFYEDEPADKDDKLGWRNRKRDHERDVADWKERKRQYEKLQKQFSRPRTSIELSFIGTPFCDYWTTLKPEITWQRPFSLDPAIRVAHQFVVSPSRSGKTTFLIAQILEDFERVKRGECSLIAMDSENELIPQLAKLAVFGAGGELEGKLIYLEPTEYPLALNIFDRGDVSGENDEMYRGALTTTQFFINSIGKTETTGHQDIVLKFAVQALMCLPGATVSDLQDLLKDRWFAANKDRFIDLDPNVARVMEVDIHGDMKASTSAVRSRVTGIISDPLFRKVFAQKENKLDFFDLLQTPKVVLISTAGLDDATGPFGRFIIAKLYEAVMKRKFIPKSSKLPIWCYIDEASHYVPNEPMFANMIDRVAKQGLGLIIATQRSAHITDANVLDALKRVAIQVQTRKPNAIISIDGAEPITVHVPLIDLTNMPLMTEGQQAAHRQQMATQFGPDKQVAPQPELVSEPAHAAPPPRGEKPQPRTPPKSPPTEGDETDAKPW